MNFRQIWQDDRLKFDQLTDKGVDTSLDKARLTSTEEILI